MRLLLLSRWLPYPADNGSKIRVFNVLKQLARRHDVDMLSFHDASRPVDPAHLDVLRRYCTTVGVFPYPDFHPTSASAVAGLLSSQPRSLIDTHSAELSSAIARHIESTPCEMVVASEIDMLPYVLEVPGVPVVLDELQVSVHWDRTRTERGIVRRLRARLTWIKLHSYLRRVLPRVATCIVASPQEQALVQSIAGGATRVEVIPNAVDVSDYPANFGPREPNTLVYAGALTFGANFDAVKYFLDDIFPIIRKSAPDVRFRVTGSYDGVDLAPLARDSHVELTGHVPDVRSVVSQSSVSVVPLRVGGGTRLKILESMALGTPVVATRKGAEGLDVVDGRDVYVADEPRLFAEQTLRLLTSAEARSRLAAAGRRVVETRYDWSSVGQRLCELVDSAAVTRRQPSRASVLTDSNAF